jgi:hypothetical protein
VAKLRAYHWIPKQYFDESIKGGALYLKHGFIWLASDDKGAYRGCVNKDKRCVLLAVDTTDYEIEDASDMPLAEKYNDEYYILRSDKIAEEHFEVLFEMEASQPVGYADDLGDC